jgi:soluble lytic murein transglycosylase
MEHHSVVNGRPRRRSLKQLGVAVGLLTVLIGVILIWIFWDDLRSPQALYREAQGAKPERAAVLYKQLAEKLPAIEEYAQLWAAEAALPNLEAMKTLQTIIAFRPQSPAAYQAHLAKARHYANLEAPEAEGSYRSALALNDTLALRLELAHYLEEQGDNEGAYAEYRHILDYSNILEKRADAFAGMRRTGQDNPLTVVEDLIAATYFTDALEALRNIDDVEGLPLRAQTLTALGRYDEAEETYRDWLKEMPEDVEAQMGLAKVLLRLGRVDEALELYEEIDTPDSKLVQASLLEEEEPDQAIVIYSDSPYPSAWWAATTLLERQGRITETFPLYARLAETDTTLADDAAYRLYVLAERVGDRKAKRQGQTLLESFDLNWLALRAVGGELQLDPAPPLNPVGDEILTKVQALESLGRQELAHLELVLAARFRRTPEVDLAMAQALAMKGYVIDAQSIAEEYIEDHPRAPLAFWQLSYPRPYSTTVEAVAIEFDVDPLLIWAVMREESRYDPNALSIANAQGLMQVIPSTRAWIAEELGEVISPGEAYDPETSIRMGGWLLSFLTDYFDGDLELAISAYNAGTGSVETWQADPMVSNRDDLLRWISFGETRLYLERVLLSYQVYQELYADQ